MQATGAGGRHEVAAAQQGKRGVDHAHNHWPKRSGIWWRAV
jgi:hypothetical protein